MEEHDWVVGGVAMLFVVAAAASWFKLRVRTKTVSARPVSAVVTRVDVRPPRPALGAVHIPTVEFGDVLQRYQERSSDLERWSKQNATAIHAAKSQTFETMPLASVVSMATSQERANLCVILNIPEASAPAKIGMQIRSAGSHSAAVLARKAAGKEPYVSYFEVADDVAQKCGGKAAPGMGEAKLEQIAVAAALTKVLEKATPAERKKILKELADAQARTAKGGATVAGALVLANLSGFSLYLAASAVLSGITGVLGITLPFAAYTGLSSVLSVAIGPVGWAVLGAWVVFKLGGVNYKKTLASVFLIAAVRARLIGERDKRIAELLEENRRIVIAREQLAPLRRYVEMNKARLRADDRVPVSQVPS